jgi:DNA-binding transcriptional regulator/RsmH inhibitor MraZ
VEVEVKNVDSQGRIALPAEWRREVLDNDREVVVQREGDLLILRARKKPDLTRLFDALEVDLPTDAFKDWKKLKNALLEE